MVVGQPNRGDSPERAVFKITDCKLYVPVVILSVEIDNKLLEQLKTGFKRTIKWNKYRSEMSNQTENNNLNFLIDPTFTNVNRLFVLTFENEDDSLWKNNNNSRLIQVFIKIFFDDAFQACLCLLSSHV